MDYNIHNKAAHKHAVTAVSGGTLRLRRQRQPGEPHVGRTDAELRLRRREPAGGGERGGERRLRLRRRRPAGQGDGQRRDELQDDLFRFPTFSGLTQHARQSTIGDNL